ncbi:MAG: GAF domain-containing sensor histidine kinase [Chloroflexota bacterium]
MLSDAATLLTLPPGSLAYHLILLTILALMLALAGTPVLREAPSTRRTALAAGALLGLRLIVIGASALAGLGRLSGDSLIGPLSAFAALAGLLALGWAAAFPQRSRSGDLTIGLALLIAALGLAATLVVPTLPVADDLPVTVWLELACAVAGLLLSFVVLVLLLARRPGAWGLSLGGAVVFLAGYAVQVGVLVTQGSTQPLSGFVRLGELAAYPLFALAFARSMSAPAGELRPSAAVEPKPEEGEERAVTPLAAPPVADLLGLVTAETSSELAREAVRAISRALRAEYCLLLTPPDDGGHFAIDIGYDLISEQYIPGTPLDNLRAPIFYAALSQRRTLILPARSRSPDMQAVQTALVVETTGPAMLVPMVLDGTLYGAILTLSPYARHEWSADDRQSLEAIARTLAARLEQMRIAQARSAQASPEVLEEAQRRIQALIEENARLASESPERVAAPRPEDLATLLTMNEEARETISILEAEIERLKAAQAYRPSGTQEEVESLTQKLEGVLHELAEARARLAAMEAGGGRLPGSAAALDAEAIVSIVRDLRPPIEVIADYTSLLLGESIGTLGSTQRKFLEKVRSATELTQTLLQDLVQVATVETSKLRLSLTPVDLVRCLEQALHQTEGTLRARQVTLRLDFPDDLPAAVGEPGAITQTMAHLIQNAASVSSEGSEIVAAVKMTPSDLGGAPRFLTVSFTDTGDGIPPDQIGRVFERLSPEERARIPGVAPSSAGPSLVGALVEAMGGRVWVDSVVGVGSTFTFVLRIAESSGAPPT